jgi:tRNA(fMet)-specific endonuclease VapC
MVVDTTLFIEYLRARDKTLCALYHIPETAPRFVSAMTVYELYVGATSDSKRLDVERVLDGYTQLGFDEQVARRAAEIMIALRQTGRVIPAPDVFIAATALVHNLPIKTLNTKDFERIEGVVLV